MVINSQSKFGCIEVGSIERGEGAKAVRGEHGIHHTWEICQTFVVLLLLLPETVISKDGFQLSDAPDAPGIYSSKSGAQAPYRRG